MLILFFIIAVWNGNYAGVLSAIKAGANINSVGTSHGTYDPSSPLIDRNFLNFLKRFIFKINFKVMYNNQNNINITNLLISAGSNLNYQNKNGYSALMIGELNLQLKNICLTFHLFCS